MPSAKTGDAIRIGLPIIRHDQVGYDGLVRLYEDTKDLFLQEIEIDFSATSWFDADMCAPLGAILYKLGENVNGVRLVNLQSQVEKILSKNGFLSSYGGKKIHDSLGHNDPLSKV